MRILHLLTKPNKLRTISGIKDKNSFNEELQGGYY
jgi:hypothetical protein